MFGFTLCTSKTMSLHASVQKLLSLASLLPCIALALYPLHMQTHLHTYKFSKK